MAKKPVEEAKPITDLKMDCFWDEHVENVRPAIKELDRRQAESMARAPFIVVTNATK